MLLSSGVIWRYRDFEEFRRQCPGGDAALQRLVWERLDEALDWLERSAWRSPHTTNRSRPGARFEPGSLTGHSCGLQARSSSAGRHPRGRAADRRDRRLPGPARRGARAARPLESLVRGRRHRPRAGAGATPSAERRVLRPRDAGPRARGAVRRRLAALRPLRPARQRPRRGVLPRRGIVVGERPRAGDRRPAGRPGLVRARRRGARTAGGRREASVRAGDRAAPGGGLRVRVYAAVTHTYGGVQVDARARAADGVWVAGVDAGGISNGGYASGLAQALVLGLVAAEDACQ